MFDIGFWELLVVGLVGLLVLGPERLPKAIRSLQATARKVRQFGSRMEAEINHELRVKELHENLKKIEQAEDLENLPDELKDSLAELQRAAASVNRPYAKTAEPVRAKENQAEHKRVENPESDAHAKQAPSPKSEPDNDPS